MKCPIANHIYHISWLRPSGQPHYMRVCSVNVEWNHFSKRAKMLSELKESEQLQQFVHLV